MATPASQTDDWWWCTLLAPCLSSLTERLLTAELRDYSTRKKALAPVCEAVWVCFVCEALIKAESLACRNTQARTRLRGRGCSFVASFGSQPLRGSQTHSQTSCVSQTSRFCEARASTKISARTELCVRSARTAVVRVRAMYVPRRTRVRNVYMMRGVGSL